MTVSVEIADRLYDYTDEERAAEAIAEYQALYGLGDEAVITLWLDENDKRRSQLEKLIFDAVDANGSVKRARESVPGGVSLFVDEGAPGA